MRCDGLPRAAESVAHLADLLRAADEGDPPSTGLDQVRRGERTAGDVVDRDRAERQVGAHAVDQDGRDAAVAHPPQSRLDAADGGDEDATHAELLEEVEVAALALLLAVAGAGDHREAGQRGARPRPRR